MTDLSILIPSRNEMFLARTVKDILSNIEGDTEIITVLDGAWAEPAIPQHERVTVIHHSESIGQRAATNEAAKLSHAKYVMKCDAHCAFDKGFDVKMLAAIKGHNNWTVVPLMRNLHTFDWVCPDGHRRYQGPSGPCTVCSKEAVRDIVWIAKESPKSVSYCFDSTPHFQYFGDFAKRQEGQGEITPSMSLQGSCWMLTREKYWELNVCDESFGSWGSQGIEVAAKTWLSGGAVMVNKKTWYAHLFRTQGGDFSFPYPISGKQQQHAKDFARDLFFNDKWEKQVHPLSWLIKKFWPVPGWSDKDLKNLKGNTFKFNGSAGGTKPAESESFDEVPMKEIIYYTCNTHKPKIDNTCRKQLLKSGLPIVSVSLNKDLKFGDKRLRVNGVRGPLMMHRQIVMGLKASTAQYIFLAESDVMYHPSHFAFTPKRKDVFYFNTNVWRLRYEDGHAVWTDNLQQLSGMCASRELVLDFFTKRLAQIKKEGFNKHYEPSARQNIYPYVKGGKYGQENYLSKVPNVCIRHDMNLTKSKWAVDEFKNKEFAKGWKESDTIPGWGKGKNLMKMLK